MKVVRVRAREDEADLEPAIGVFFAPQLRHPDLPVEIINRRDMMNRVPTLHDSVNS